MKEDNVHESESSVTNSSKRPQFGTRYLKEGDNVYEYNTWDNVEWDDEQKQAAEEIIANQIKSKMTPADYEEIEKQADHFWNEFYSVHDDKFYKDRHWLFTEFTELCHINDVSSNTKIFEVGCGVGNTILPLMQRVPDSNLHVYGCDFSETAINLFKNNVSYEPDRCTTFVYDITREDNDNFPFEPNSLDFILLIYVLSAIPPRKIDSVLRKLYHYLKPGGLVFFRDYGRYDLSQMRFKKGRCVLEHFYVRGEGTFVYFFDKDEVGEKFRACGYDIVQLICDKRLQVNRRRQLKMYRVWIQGKFKKPLFVDTS